MAKKKPTSRARRAPETKAERQARLLARDEAPISRKEQNKLYSTELRAAALADGLIY